MGDAWGLAGKIAGWLILGVLAAVVTIPENRAFAWSAIQTLTETAQSVTIKGSAAESVQTLLPKTKPLPEERLLITTKKTPNYQNKCTLSFNTEEQTEIVNYFHKETNTNISIPYNKKWGNEHFMLNPYERSINNEIHFGPLVKTKTCEWKRGYVISFDKNKQNGDCFTPVEENETYTIYKRCDTLEAGFDNYNL